MGGHTFTRQELYDLVWTEPMTKAAKRYGISDQGLAKACDRAGVPAPPRGYWAKLAAGHTVEKTPLPAAGAGVPEAVTINPPGQRPKPPPPPPAPASVQEKIEEEARERNVKVPATLSSPHRIVSAWLADDRRRWEDVRFDPHWRSRFEHIDGTPLKKRRLRIMSTLFKALEERGYTLRVEGHYDHQVYVDWKGDKLRITSRERLKQVRRPVTDEERAEHSYMVNQKWKQEQVATGELVVILGEERGYPKGPRWTDAPDVPLDERINEILGGIAAAFEERRLERIREAERQAEEHRRSMERYRQEQERKREVVRFRRLVDATEDRRTAAEIRDFVAFVEASTRATEEPERFRTWKTWALGHADRLDPLQYEDVFSLEVEDRELWSLKE